MSLVYGREDKENPAVQSILCKIIKKRKEKKMYKKILIFVAFLILSACSLFGSYYEPEAVGIGKDINELKLSPCACMQIEVIKDVPDWFWETI